MTPSDTTFRLGIDGREFLPGLQTGIGRYIRNFLSHAPARHPEAVFHVYGNQHTQFDLASGNIALRIQKEGRTLWWDQRVLPRLAEEDGIDLLLSPYDKGPIRLACPLVLTIHDLLFLIVSEKSGLRRAVYDRLYTMMHRPMIRNAVSILTVSEFSKAEICRIFSVAPEKVSVIPNSIPHLFKPMASDAEKGAFRERLGLNTPYLLYVGNFKPHKNVPALVDAYAALPNDTRRCVDLVLCGRDDPFRREVAARADRLGIAEHVKFIDYVDDDDLVRLYGCANAFVFPSRFEGFGMPPLEAMACGTPVVSSNATSLSEVVGTAGLLVEPETEALSDGIRRVLEDTDVRDRLTSTGFEHVERYRPDGIAEDLYQTLRSIHSESAGQP